MRVEDYNRILETFKRVVTNEDVSVIEDTAIIESQISAEKFDFIKLGDFEASNESSYNSIVESVRDLNDILGYQYKVEIIGESYGDIVVRYAPKSQYKTFESIVLESMAKDEAINILVKDFNYLNNI